MKSNIYKSTYDELKLIVGDTGYWDEKIFALTPQDVRQYIEAWAFINTNWNGNKGGVVDLDVTYYVDIRIDGSWCNARTNSAVDIPEFDKPEQFVELKKKNFSVWCRPQNGYKENKKFARHNLKPCDGINSWGTSYITITKK